MKFIADAMLGRLARWLRFMGFDTLYYPDIDDKMLIKIARRDDRWLLTRDTRLIKIRGLSKYLLLKENDSIEQLKEVMNAFKLRKNKRVRRCVKCNGILNRIKKKTAIKDLVPDFVYHNFSRFYKCNECNKIYWEGSHLKSFTEMVDLIVD
jgi:uncharacterized protein with PIN domain